MPANLYENNLIQRCCDGDRTAYRELYDYTAGELLAIAMRYMKSKMEAEDVLQEAYIKILRGVILIYNNSKNNVSWYFFIFLILNFHDFCSEAFY